LKNTDLIYPHANTVVCIEEDKLLKQFEYGILYDLKGLDAALYELNGINYFHTYKNAEADNYNTMLDGLMKATLDLLKEISPYELVWRMFTLYYDIHNIKLVVKEKFTGSKLDYLALDYGGYSLPTLRSAAVRDSDDILHNPVLTDGLFEALHANDMYDIDFILDKVYFKVLKTLAFELDNDKISSFITEKIDLYNISVYLQHDKPEDGYFKKAFSDRGSSPEALPLLNKYSSVLKDRNIDELDVLIDNYLIEKTKICKLAAFGIEPICAYFFNKLMEIKNIRILLTGKEKNYSTDEIKKRMRIPYEL